MIVDLCATINVFPGSSQKDTAYIKIVFPAPARCNKNHQLKDLSISGVDRLTNTVKP